MVSEANAPVESGRSPPKQALWGLDALNFFLADIEGGLGPYLAIYLLTVEHWTTPNIGIVMTMGGIAGLIAQTPAGALVDATHRKRTVLIVAAILITAGSLMLPVMPNFSFVAGTQILTGAAGAIFPPAIAAVTLGIVGPKLFARRNGRIQAFNHAGNAFAGIVIGGTALVWGPIVVFWFMAAMAALSAISILTIPPDAINHDVARGLTRSGDNDQPSGFRVLLRCRPLLTFAGCVVLFHLANAAMLPLVGQELAVQNKTEGTMLISLCIVLAQIVMVPMAMLVGAKANAWGSKPLFLAGFLILPLRGVLYTLSDNSYWLLSVQTLDGVGAGIYGALFPIVVADLTRGTGRFNVSQGAIATAQGIGASLSAVLAETIVARGGYDTAFLTLAGIAAAGFLLYLFAMPNTSKTVAKTGDSISAAAGGRGN